MKSLLITQKSPFLEDDHIHDSTAGELLEHGSIEAPVAPNNQPVREYEVMVSAPFFEK